MKKRFYILFPALLCTGFLLVSFGGSDLKYSGGAPAGYTNSPADAKNCSFCHGGTVTLVTDWVTSDIPVGGYTPGVTYNITVTAIGGTSLKKGFEISPQDASGNLVGTLIPKTGNKFADGNSKYITHSSAQSASPATWNFQWTAPINGTGEVTFYAAIVSGKTNIKVTTYAVQENNVGISSLADIKFKIYPNPSSGLINIALNNALNRNVEIKLLGLNGNISSVLYQGIVTDENSSLHFNLKTMVVSGTYLIEIVTENSKSTKKVILL